jgi:hypothetical protein
MITPEPFPLKKQFPSGAGRLTRGFASSHWLWTPLIATAVLLALLLFGPAGPAS